MTNLSNWQATSCWYKLTEKGTLLKKCCATCCTLGNLILVWNQTCLLRASKVNTRGSYCTVYSAVFSTKGVNDMLEINNGRLIEAKWGKATPTTRAATPDTSIIHGQWTSDIIFGALISHYLIGISHWEIIDSMQFIMPTSIAASPTWVFPHAHTHTHTPIHTHTHFHLIDIVVICIQMRSCSFSFSDE